MFHEWCVKAGAVSFQSSVNVILTFLQEVLDRNNSLSTVNKVYLAAMSACHVGFGDKTADTLCPLSKPLAPPWDLPMVLGILSCPPFEPLQQIDFKMFSLKTTLLVALAMAKESAILKHCQ